MFRERNGYLIIQILGIHFFIMTTTSVNKHPSLLDPERIKFIKKIESKKCVFDELTELLIKGQKEVTKHEVFDALIEREKMGNTSIGNGISVPKAHLPITNPRAAILVIKKGLYLGAADKQPTTIFLALLIPDNQRDQYSMMLSTLNQKLILNGIPESIITSKNSDLLAKHFESLLYDDLQILMSNTNIEVDINESTSNDSTQTSNQVRENE